MDRYMALAGAALDAEVHRTIYVLGPADEPNPCNAFACQFDDRIYTSRAPHEHELIHAVRESDGAAYRFFAEGEAVAFGEEDELFPEAGIAGGSLRDGIESCAGGESLHYPWYTRAGHFFAYLHRYHGVEATSELFRTAPRRATSQEAIAALEASTAMDFDDLVADLGATDPFCEQPRWFRYPLYPCDAPEALRPRCDGDIAIPVGTSLDCADETALGPRDGSIYGYVAIEIPTDGYYRIKGPPRDGAGQRGSVEIKECALGCSSRSIAFAYHGLDHEVWLRAGRYSLRFRRNAEASTLTSMAVLIEGDCG